MAFALAVIGAIYLVLEVLLLLLAISTVQEHEIGALLGCLMFMAAIPVLLVVHIGKAGSFALRGVRFDVVAPARLRELEALVERVAAQADVPAPTLAFLDVRTPNAYAVTTAVKSVVVLTRGLVESLEDQEIEAVVGHEIAHIANRDSAVMTFASGPTLAGSAYWHDQDLFGKGIALMFVPLWGPIYLLSLLLMWSISRYREYVADRGSALITGAPEQLMSALAKIGGEAPRGDLRGGAAISALCIVTSRPRRRFELFMDHPPIDKRLHRLEEIARDLGRTAR